ncbi:hypothetical protein, partial [Actinoplanes philippinensis]|uniref:hypothetical protein n=1 Tax=Actinoplanes philippinensis TaxID=35752 RepID=UPI00340280E2
MRDSRARRRAATAAVLLTGGGLLAIVGPASEAVAAGGPATTDSALAFSVKLDIGQLNRACTGDLGHRRRRRRLPQDHPGRARPVHPQQPLVQ